eukprot:CAMPEP_0206533754 /NCGR_PEP_ID=MMETSP0325_2-20121206/5146_1 /ASSEMBLY_ACC=CAM_ASM_000347 /TAXON_ID=2866 /ORGANISM="Crypthecodinium cohnii, Strain Seligo" /LENGTH=898 /DNA_ID=CAMNT_0054030443 /DNA_START=101 /DNA_END=2793 /DNA_ORIENTATION=-
MSEVDVEALLKEVEALRAEKEEWKQEQERWKSRCAKLARASKSAPSPSSSPPAAAGGVPSLGQGVDVGVQTDPELSYGLTNGALHGGEDRAAPDAADQSPGSLSSAGRLHPVLDQMLRNPKDPTVQMKGIETLFAQQTQVDGNSSTVGPSSLQASLEAAVAVFGHHPTNRPLLLKACQLLSVLLAEPGSQQQLPSVSLWQALRSVVAVAVQLIADAEMDGFGISTDGGMNATTSLATLRSTNSNSAAASPALKLLNWLLSLLALLLPCSNALLKDQANSEALLQELLESVIVKLLNNPEVASQEPLLVKCIQLLHLLPMEPWVQKVCLSSGLVHGLALLRQRFQGNSPPDAPEAPLAKTIQVAVRGVFADNLELCVAAVDDTFVNDDFVCLEVLDQIRSMEKRRRGTFRDLDRDHGIIGKVLQLWGWRQRLALEAEAELENAGAGVDPSAGGATSSSASAAASSSSKTVLHKVAELLSAVVLKLPPALLLQRMKDFESSEVFMRLALAAIHSSAQLKLQVAVNYLDNDAIGAVVSAMQLLLQSYEAPTAEAGDEMRRTFALLKSEALPAEGWPYLTYGLEVCLHILSHWTATKLSLDKDDTLDARAAPLLMAKGGLVDILAEILDPVVAGVELTSEPPRPVLHKVTDTLQALFEQSGHICVFCLQHYIEVKPLVALACESLSVEPLANSPEMQQQAVTQLVAAYERVDVQDERLARKLMKALTALFESSYELVAWFLQNYSLKSLGAYQSVDVHVEAVRAVCRAPYWSAEDAPLLPAYVSVLAQMMLQCVEGQGDDAKNSPTASGSGRILELTEAQELVAACTSSVLHLLLIDPTPPSVLRVLSRNLAGVADEDVSSSPSRTLSPTSIDHDTKNPEGDEKAVAAVIRTMTVFASSDRV